MAYNTCFYISLVLVFYLYSSLYQCANVTLKYKGSLLTYLARTSSRLRIISVVQLLSITGTGVGNLTILRCVGLSHLPLHDASADHMSAVIHRRGVRTATFRALTSIRNSIGGGAYEARRLVPPQNLGPGGTLWSVPPQNFCC